MGFEPLPRWSLVCNGSDCDRAWMGYIEDDGDRVSVIIQLDAPELTAEDREVLAADGWLVCLEDGSRVLCPVCRAAAAAALLGPLPRSRRSPRRRRPGRPSRSRPPGRT